MTVETSVAKPTQTCAEFQDQLAELAGSSEDLRDDEHLKSCENCTALVSDLQAIVDAVKLLLPLHDPSPAVWENITKKLESETAT